MEGVRMKFGARLRQLREEAELVQTEFAERAGVPLGTLRDYEQERRLPSWVAVVRMCRALGVSVDTFNDCDEVAAEPAGQRRAGAGRKEKPRRPRT
jgi:transcriptional regulator with XRE-family HTH domain